MFINGGKKLKSFQANNAENEKKHSFALLKVISVITVLILLVITLYTTIPLCYLGKFNTNEYKQYVDVNMERSELKNVGKTDDFIKAYKATNNLLTQQNSISPKIKDNSFYVIRFDKENEIWMISLRYKYSMFNGILFEGMKIFIDTNGYVLGIFTGI